MERKYPVLLIASSEVDSNLYYATRFLAPDPFIFLEIKGEKILVMSDLEIDRAKSQARVDTVLSFSAYESVAKQRGISHPGVVDVVDQVLRERDIRTLSVPSHFPVDYADDLRRRGYDLVVCKDPFYPERLIKSEEEIAWIEETQAATEEAVEEAITTLRRSEIRGDLLYCDGEVLTSERVRRMIHFTLLEKGCVAQHTIVACGIQACDPHNEGSGPLHPHEPIILDVFPQSLRTRYYADMTRTVVKGEASPGLRRLYETVRCAQEVGIHSVRAGAEGRKIHEEVCRVFSEAGYETGWADGRIQGFFHGTGHGVGLDIHEPPRISRSEWTLQAGNAVTVEPGLYYPAIGAVRIEDLVVVTDHGCRNLTTYPKFLEV